MDAALADLLVLLDLERLEVNLYRGMSRDIGSPQVFGGQVLGQALMAATATVDDRVVHSLHAYFLRAGDFNLPIVYEVDRSRDGSHFSSRRVVAIQNGQQIFHMSASFQSPEEGLEHQLQMPDVPPPESLPERSALANSPLVTEQQRRFFSRVRPFDIRLVVRLGLLPADDGDLAAWHSVPEQATAVCQHRPRHVVPSPRPSRRVVAVFHGQPQCLWCARTLARQHLHA